MNSPKMRERAREMRKPKRPMKPMKLGTEKLRVRIFSWRTLERARRKELRRTIRSPKIALLSKEMSLSDNSKSFIIMINTLTNDNPSAA